jgi:hypothetical protein
VLTGSVKKELNQLRRNSVVGTNLFNSLARLDQQHNLRDWDRQTKDRAGVDDPEIHFHPAL